MTDVGFPSEETTDEELNKAFALETMFGCLKFVTNAEGKKWPIDVLYGIPTLSLELCDQVIGEIEKRDMLGEENIARLADETQRITGELEEFVAKWSCNIGHPVRPLYAIDGNLQWI